MLAEELRGLTDTELSNRVRDLREQLFKLRFQKSTGQSESGARLRGVRREVARALTVQRHRELTEQRAAAAAQKDQ